MYFLAALSLLIATDFEIQQTERDEQIQVVPFEIKGSVENFDPVLRAKELAESIPKHWCGSYRSFSDESELDIRLTIQTVKAIGQIVDFRGDMMIGRFKTAFQGHLNAKSDQLELIPISNSGEEFIYPYGKFMGLQGASILGWKPTNLNSPGGRLNFQFECKDEGLESLSDGGLW